MFEVEGPWVLLGDFYCTLQAEERNTGSEVSSSFMELVE